MLKIFFNKKIAGSVSKLVNFISFFSRVIKLHLQVDCFLEMGIYQLKVCRSFKFSCIVTKHNPLKKEMPLRRTEIEK